MDDLVSVVISTYKRPREILLRAVNSIVNQTYLNLEIIIVDDNHDSDKLDSDAINELKSLDSRINYMTYPGNHGASYARNYGANTASGTYLAFLDDDDEYLPEKITKQVELISQNDEYALITCDSEYVFLDTDGRITGREKFVQFDDTEISLEDILLSGQSGVPIPLFRLKLFRRVGGFDETLMSSQDLDLWIRLAQIGRIGRVPEVLFRVYWHMGERISTNVKAKVAGNRSITRKYKHLANDRHAFLVRQDLDLAEVLFSAGKIFRGVWHVLLARMNSSSEMERERMNKLIRYGITRFHETHMPGLHFREKHN